MLSAKHFFLFAALASGVCLAGVTQRLLPRCPAAIDALRDDARGLASVAFEDLVARGMKDVVFAPTKEEVAPLFTQLWSLSHAPHGGSLPALAPHLVLAAQRELANDGGALRVGPLYLFTVRDERPYVFLRDDATAFELEEELDHYRYWRQLRAFAESKGLLQAAELAGQLLAFAPGVNLVAEARARLLYFEPQQIDRYDQDPGFLATSTIYPRFQALMRLTLMHDTIGRKPWKTWRGARPGTRAHVTKALEDRERSLVAESARVAQARYAEFANFFAQEARQTMGATAFDRSLKHWSAYPPERLQAMELSSIPHPQRLVVAALRLRAPLSFERVFPEGFFSVLGEDGNTFRRHLTPIFQAQTAAP